MNLGVINFSRNADEDDDDEKDEDEKGDDEKEDESEGDEEKKKKKKKRKKKKKGKKSDKSKLNKKKRTPVERVFRVFYKLDEANYPPLWTTQSYVHIMGALVHLAASGYLVVLYFFLVNYVSLYDGYNGTALVILLMALSGSGAPVSILSALLVCYSMTQKRLGRCRYQMFYATGSSAVLALTSVVLTSVGLGSFFTVTNIFQAGFYLNMMKFHEDEVVKAQITSLQERFECCGNTNYTDWFAIGWSPSITATKVGLPISCCKKQGQGGAPCVEFAELEEINSLTPYHEGCNGKVQSRYILFSLIACIMFAVCLVIDVLTTGLAYMNSQAALAHEALIFEDRMKIIPHKLRANRLMRAKRNKIMRS